MTSFVQAPFLELLLSYYVRSKFASSKTKQTFGRIKGLFVGLFVFICSPLPFGLTRIEIYYLVCGSRRIIRCKYATGIGSHIAYQNVSHQWTPSIRPASFRQTTARMFILSRSDHTVRTDILHSNIRSESTVQVCVTFKL